MKAGLVCVVWLVVTVIAAMVCLRSENRQAAPQLPPGEEMGEVSTDSSIHMSESDPAGVSTDASADSFGVSRREELVDDMPKILDVIPAADSYVALCEDGTVWEWAMEQTMEEAHRIPGLENVTKIMEAGDDFRTGGEQEYTVLVLEEDGSVCGWGNDNSLINVDPETNSEIFFPEPVRLEWLSEIVEMDAHNGKAFAVDSKGTFYGWGLDFLWDSIWDCRTGYPDQGSGLSLEVEQIYAGAAGYNYFINRDGTIWAVMEAYIWDYPRYIWPFIFPVISGQGMSSDFTEFDSSLMWGNPKENGNYEMYNGLEIFSVEPYEKFGKTFMYAVGKCEDIELIGSDTYTMFVYDGRQNVLWYWDSRWLRYQRDDLILGADTGCEDFSGQFVKVDFVSLFFEQSGEEDEPRIVDICTARDKVLFLTDTGQVFMSEYVTGELRDVEYWWRRPGIGDSGPDIWTNVEVQELTFSIFEDPEGIVCINTDGRERFTAVDGDGAVYMLDVSAEDGGFEKVE